MTQVVRNEKRKGDRPFFSASTRTAAFHRFITARNGLSLQHRVTAWTTAEAVAGKKPLRFVQQRRLWAKGHCIARKKMAEWAGLLKIMRRPGCLIEPLTVGLVRCSVIRRPGEYLRPRARSRSISWLVSLLNFVNHALIRGPSRLFRAGCVSILLLFQDVS